MRNFDLAKSYIESTSRRVDGWFYPLDMLLFAYLCEAQDESTLSGDLCEVGVWHGKSLALLALMAAPGEQAHGFDLYVDDCRERTQATLESAGVRDGVAVLVKADSLACTPASLRDRLPRPVRFLHVDAGHEFSEALADLENFSALLGPTGVIAVDDYYDRAFPGVAAATHAFLQHGGSTRFVPFVIGHNKIYLCNPALAGHYQRRLITKPPFAQDLRVQRMYEHPVLIPFAGKLAGDAKDMLSLLAS